MSENKLTPKQKNIFLMLTAIIVTIALVISIAIIVNANQYSKYMPMSTLSITSHTIKSDYIVFNIKTSRDIKSAKFNIEFSSANNTYVSNNFKIDKLSEGNTIQCGIDLKEVKENLNGENPKKLKINNASGYIKDKGKLIAIPRNIIITLITSAFIIFAIFFAFTGYRQSELNKAKREEDERQERIRKTNEKIEEERLWFEQERIRQKEELLRQEQERIDEENKRKTKCIICNDCSMGEIICTRCSQRKEIFKTELPTKRFDTYENTHKYRKELISSIIESLNGFQKEADSLKLLAVDEYLETTYKDKIQKEDISLLKDIHAGVSKDTLKNLYQIELTAKKTYKTADAELNDHRNQNPKPYRCKDGDYVRSKAEREIDNFWFDNRIWHIYENQYKHPVTGKTAEPDFFLPDYNLYIEYFGMTDANYIRQREEKIDMYRSDKSINFEYLTYKDDANIYERLEAICRKYSVPLK